ncbi:hypothetical protein B0T24DRAFT_315524 [Lasiosphaeria ovina]|uniref:Uncharacterized protein n=1 Tax=Lasiosphaeria ovina TaxID=92902 RepID=A0AAE0K7J1_9PEZI|nr:hypothetical protein B0T24DRAFT_315524 [Lasiosphaeria ovina]
MAEWAMSVFGPILLARSRCLGFLSPSEGGGEMAWQLCPVSGRCGYDDAHDTIRIGILYIPLQLSANKRRQGQPFSCVWPNGVRQAQLAERLLHRAKPPLPALSRQTSRSLVLAGLDWLGTVSITNERGYL